MTTENQREAERLLKMSDDYWHDIYWGRIPPNILDDITAALDAAEQRGREKALEDAYYRIEAMRDRWINAGGFGQMAVGAGNCLTVIRAMKGEKK